MNCIIHAGSCMCPSFPHDARCGFPSSIHNPRWPHSSWYYVICWFFRLESNILKVTRIRFTQCPHISLQEFSTRCLQLHGPARSVDLYLDTLGPKDESFETIWRCCQPGQRPATSVELHWEETQDAIGKLNTQPCTNQAWKAYNIRLLWSNCSG